MREFLREKKPAVQTRYFTDPNAHFFCLKRGFLQQEVLQRCTCIQSHEGGPGSIQWHLHGTANKEGKHRQTLNTRTEASRF